MNKDGRTFFYQSSEKIHGPSESNRVVAGSILQGKHFDPLNTERLRRSAN
jgi:hypothetical protein